MANRSFSQYRYSLEKKVTDLFAVVTIGAAGAPTLDTVNSKGIASIVRSSAGLYVVTLSDRYTSMLEPGVMSMLAAGTPGHGSCILRATAVNAVVPTVTLAFLDYAGAAVDPVSTTVLYIGFTLKNSSV